MAGLSLKSSAAPTWYPVPIHYLDALLIKVIHQGRGYPTSYALRRNIAYNLQYIEFLDRCLLDLKLSSVIETQTWKSFIVAGCGVMESLLNFLLVANGVHATTDWRLSGVATSNPKDMDGVNTKIETHVFQRLSAPVPEEMTFDAMIKKAEANRVLGPAHAAYAPLNRLRRLRNRVHLQVISHATDTDFNAFKLEDAEVMAKVLLATFTSSVFSPTAAERAYFDYLRRY